MAHISEVLPIIVDPNHERFGQIGKMLASDPEYGDYYISFEDSAKMFLNDGWKTIIPQFIAPLKEHEAGIHRLQVVLPDMRDSLVEFTEQLVSPLYSDANKMRNEAARTGFVALINAVIFQSA